ncbi:hypothetical protein AB4391_24685 [Vibrio lentus]|uniref:Uncharacterized protein n=1 Tax=Vibrio lentus TaxID=136468 RepID=A0A2N7KLV3_9VIBR|nr:hypothetical protein [Vibrio lentus]PMM77433.1 hypothetical protein BCT49_20980 [Vibrio lentus]
MRTFLEKCKNYNNHLLQVSSVGLNLVTDNIGNVINTTPSNSVTEDLKASYLDQEDKLLNYEWSNSSEKRQKVLDAFSETMIPYVNWLVENREDLNLSDEIDELLKDFPEWSKYFE